MERHGNTIILTPDEQRVAHLPAGIKIDSVEVVYRGLGDRISALNEVCRGLSAPAAPFRGMEAIRLGKLAAASGLLHTLNSMQTQLRELAPEQFPHDETNDTHALLQDLTEDINPGLWALLESN